MERRKPLARTVGLTRRTALSPGTGPSKLRATPPSRTGAAKRRAAREREPGRATWKTRRIGRCAVCRAYGSIFRHHVLLEQVIRAAKGDPWDLRNALDVGYPLVCSCHADHHAGGDGRIPYRLVPQAAVEFARETIGDGPAAIYFYRRYRDAPDPLDLATRITNRREQHVSD